MTIQAQLFILGIVFVALLTWGVRSYDRMQYRKRVNANLMRHCRKLEERDIRGGALLDFLIIFALFGLTLLCLWGIAR